MVFPTIKRHGIHLFLPLFAHMYVCIGQKYYVSKALFSLLVCMYWSSRTSTPSQSEIFCLIACSYTAEREYFTLGGCVGLGRPLHTYEQREQGLWDRMFLANADIQAERMPFIYQYIHETVQNQVSWCYTNVMKNSNFSIMNNFPLLLTKPKFITFIPS